MVFPPLASLPCLIAGKLCRVRQRWRKDAAQSIDIATVRLASSRRDLVMQW
jgi:hypothetical protein